MKLVAGLGNPGPRYRNTRHNVGFRVADVVAAREGTPFDASAQANALVARLRTPPGQALLVKPLTMMNLSGEAIGALARYFRIEPADVLVIADEVALPLGRLRARRGGSHGGHNGFRSVSQHLGTDAWPRVRVGIGRGDARRDLADHVLATFDADEQPVIDEAIDRAADAVQIFLTEGIEAVMNRFNAATPEERSEQQSHEKDSQA